MNATAPSELGVKMTIHVYTVNREGKVTSDRGTVSVRAKEGPLPLDLGFPRCTCSRCRAGQAVAP